MEIAIRNYVQVFLPTNREETSLLPSLDVQSPTETVVIALSSSRHVAPICSVSLSDSFQ